MSNLLLERSLRALAHPLTIGSAVVLALNALVFQPLVPSWWTGKIGGLAWLLVAPWLVLAGLAAVLPERLRARGPWAEGVLTLVAAVYALVKAVPVVNEGVMAAFGVLGFRPKLALDPSDLLALPVIAIAYAMWRATTHVPAAPASAAPRSTRLALVLALAAVLADSPAPQYYGPRCLVARDGQLRAYSMSSTTGYFQPANGRVWDSVFVSTDGGQTWNQEGVDDQAPDITQVCSQVAWPTTLGDGQVPLYYVQGQGVYVSADDGVTLVLEQRVDTIHSSLIDTVSGSLIVAAGEQGIFVRTPDGEWSQPVE
jgi:hypothetical protein